MFKILSLILVIMSSTVFAQQSGNNEQKEKPKSVLLDEFGKISNKEIKLRAQKLREKFLGRESKDSGLVAYLIFYTDDKVKTSKDSERLIIDVLLDDCRDCYGFGNNPFVFVESSKLKEQKIQFWVVPRGAEPPTP